VALGSLATGSTLGGVLGIWLGGRLEAAYGWRMALVSVVLRYLPRWLYDRLFARAPRKARGLSR